MIQGRPGSDECSMNTVPITLTEKFQWPGQSLVEASIFPSIDRRIRFSLPLSVAHILILEFTVEIFTTASQLV